MDEAIICFESTSQAIMAEQAFLERKLDVRVMPKPSSIKAGCGFCLRFMPEALEQAVAFLSECGVNITETYRMVKEPDGTVSYLMSNKQ
ncbi:MAG: DUF3343 domain-containing protein [Spirochaetaceae bacterium]|jgi:hypothetical protein|nr:DUF3343 domain-containing protein [Spirochaetaceae bacterium]